MRKPIAGYVGVYEIDEEGRVFSLPRLFVNTLGRRVDIKARERKPSLSSYGYLTIRLSDRGVIKTHRLHRLVAEAFVPNPRNLPFVNHIDGNKANPKADNLEWVTAQKNTDHAVKHGMIFFSGENNPSAKLTDKAVEEALDRCLAGELVQMVAIELAVSRNTLVNRFHKSSRASEWRKEAMARKSTASKIRWNNG